MLFGDIHSDINGGNFESDKFGTASLGSVGLDPGVTPFPVNVPVIMEKWMYNKSFYNANCFSIFNVTFILVIDRHWSCLYHVDRP